MSRWNSVRRRAQRAWTRGCLPRGCASSPHTVTLEGPAVSRRLRQRLRRGAGLPLVIVNPAQIRAFVTRYRRPVWSAPDWLAKNSS
jgi:hypothetical protein